jgi:Ca2+-binding RTX toxin-like protein
MTALQGWIVIGLLVLIVLGIVGIGAEIKELPYLWRTHDAGSGTQSLTFKYTVQPGDNIADLQVTGLNLNGGTIHDSAGIPLTGPVQGVLGLQIDTTAPIPFMSDVVKNSNNSLTTLSGMSEAGSTVSVFDGTKALGTVKADSLGDWSLQANISGGTHSFTETATDLAGNTGASAGVTEYAPGGNKTLTGGSGNDFLIGGKNDALIGGAGNDTFVFNQGFGKETVADFNTNQDGLAFDHTLFGHDTAAQVLSQTHDTNAGAVIVVDAHDTVTLAGVTVAQLQAAQAAHLNWVHFI